jgi:DNA-binding MarR family transcriptional regulator
MPGMPDDDRDAGSRRPATLSPVPGSAPGRPAGGLAFLLAQVGAQAAQRFAELLTDLRLSPPQAGILRAIAARPGRSQQALSTELGLIPSRMVAFVDALEQRGVIERRRNSADRRLHALHLTPAGEALLGEVSRAARQHEEETAAGLAPEQRTQLAELLGMIARQQGLAPGVHPGYRLLGRADET